MLTLTSARMNSALNPKATSDKIYKIGELALLTGATTRTLRYYEELGLLQPIRNTSGQRLYSEAALTRLGFINELKSGGFSLIEIKSFFESWQSNDTGAAAAQATVTIIQQKILEISDLQKKIAKLNDELRAMVGFLMACRTCDDKPSTANCSTCDKHEGTAAPEFLMNLLQDTSKPVVSG
jgi:DNA-binding transcriptional MerR regulator